MKDCLWFERLACSFRNHHSSSGNVFFHLFLTPGMFIFVYAILKLYLEPYYILALNVAHVLLVLLFVPKLVGLLTIITHVGVVLTVLNIDLELWEGLFYFALCYFGQDISHIVTGEATLMGTYISLEGGFADHWFRLLLEHTVFLTPLVWDAAIELDHPLVAIPLENGTIVHSKNTSVEQQQDMETIRDWTLEQGEATEHTIHHWFEDLKGGVYDAYDRLANSEDIFQAFYDKFPQSSYNVVVLEGMNEIYQTAPDHYSSDRVFYQQHVDGPWCLFPGCYVYRALLSMTENTNIKTIFPLDKSHVLLKTGDCVAFDFNREIHYIESIRPDVFESRIALKLHYAVYPKFLTPMGWLVGYLTTLYDQIARWWFLQNLTPEMSGGIIGTWLTLAATHLTYLFHCKIGSPNFMRLCFIFLCNKYAWPGSWIYLISYVHYIQYIGTFYKRKNICYGRFVRTAVLFKILSTFTLVHIFLENYEYNPVAYAFIAVGVILSFSSSFALGPERTLFGVELGHYPEKWINCFPYNLGIPHPMITGALLYLIGVGMMPKIQENYQFFIPLHMMFYSIHLVQEHFDIHMGRRVFTPHKPRLD